MKPEPGNTVKKETGETSEGDERKHKKETINKKEGSTVKTVEKCRTYYTKASWLGKNKLGKSCACPCEPACYKNPHYDEEWSTSDEEGERIFYTRGDWVTDLYPYKRLGKQCLKTRKITTDRVDKEYMDTKTPTINPKEYVKKQQQPYNEDDRPLGQLGQRPGFCKFCKQNPCVWMYHQTDILTHVLTHTRRDVEENQRDVEVVSEMRSRKRKLAYQHASHLINGYLGTGNRIPHKKCVVMGVRATYPDPVGKYMGYKST
jgi:hypothetical protein